MEQVEREALTTSPAWARGRANRTFSFLPISEKSRALDLYGPNVDLVPVPSTCEPWERWPREPTRTYDRFCAFRDLGAARTLGAAARACSVGSVMLGEAARVWFWRERTDAWDDHLSQLAVHEREETIRDMTRRHVAASQKLQVKALAVLEDLASSRFAPEDILEYVLKGMEAERQAVGLPAGGPAPGPAASSGTNVAVGVFSADSIRAMMARETTTAPPT